VTAMPRTGHATLMPGGAARRGIQPRHRRRAQTPHDHGLHRALRRSRPWAGPSNHKELAQGGRTSRPHRLWSVMSTPGGEDHIEQFVLELLRTGYMLTELVANLAEALPTDAYPGETPGAVVIDMLRGTIATALVSADPQDVQRATELIQLAVAQTLEHMRLACELSERIQGDGESLGRTYG
jgi:hypothetical protein